MTSEANPHYFATTTKDDTSIDQITDSLDFPHTGLIKALSLGMKGNYALKGSATDFDITQAGSGNVVQVAAGKIYRDGAFLAVAAKNFTASDFQATSSTYHLLVADSASPPVLQIRKHSSSTQNKVPEYTEGDTIIAVLTYTSDGFNDMTVQYLTTGKVSNNVSIGYDSSGYTEALSISASAGDTTIENKVQDKDIIFKVNDGGASTEVMRIDGSESKVGIGTGDTISANLHIQGTGTDDDNPILLVETTDAGTATGPELVLYRNSSSAADDDALGHVLFRGKNDAGSPQDVTYAQIYSKIGDMTDGTEDGQLFFRTILGGTLHNRLEINKDEIAVNNGSNDVDFRVEGNGNTHTLFVNGNNDKVAIGTSAVDTNSLLTVEGAISLDEISAPTNTADRGQLYTNADNHLHFINGAGNDIKVTEEVFIVSASDETSDLTTGDDKVLFHAPFAFQITGVKATVSQVPTGSVLTVDLDRIRGGVRAAILSTKLTIDANELTSTTAATAAVINASTDDIALDDAITVNIDGIGSSNTGKGLKVTIIGYRT